MTLAKMKRRAFAHCLGTFISCKDDFWFIAKVYLSVQPGEPGKETWVTSHHDFQLAISDTKLQNKEII